MALMFTRLAHNFAKNGYYPTDEATIQTILDRLSVEPGSKVRIFDPCCGEGCALAETKQYLSEFNVQCEALGIELNEERAKYASTILDHCLQSDIEDTLFSKNGVGLIFLNPPYGLKNKDSETLDKSDRLEEVFYKKSLPALQYGGVMVLIIPAQSITEKFANYIASGLTNISVGLAPERQFKQVVIMGQRVRQKDIDTKQLESNRNLILNHVSAPIWEPSISNALIDTYVYDVPGQTSEQFRPISIKPTAEALEEDFLNTGISQTLWPTFERIFPSLGFKDKKAPLVPLRQWHAALALAAGQVTGIINSNDGSRKLLIKGRTYKDKTVKTEITEDATVTTSIDRFVPSIKAIDVTENSDQFGEIFTIS